MRLYIQQGLSARVVQALHRRLERVVSMATEGESHSMAAEGEPHIDGVPGEGELRGNDGEGEPIEISNSSRVGNPWSRVGSPWSHGGSP